MLLTKFIAIMFFLIGFVLSGNARAQAPQSVRPWLGVELDADDRPGATPGVRLKSIFKGTPAEGAGLMADDIVQEVSQRKVTTPPELIKAVADAGVGTTVTLKFLRQGKPMTKDIKLVIMPDMMTMTKNNWLNHAAPQMDLPVLRSKTLKPKSNYQLGKASGRVTLLKFWATWCVACVQAHPAVADFAQKNEDKVDVIAIASDKLPALKRHFGELSKHLPEKKDPIIYLHDEQGELSKKLMTPAIPMFVLIDKKGTIVEIELGGGTILQGLLQKAQTLANQ